MCLLPHTKLQADRRGDWVCHPPWTGHNRPLKPQLAVTTFVARLAKRKTPAQNSFYIERPTPFGTHPKCS